MPQGHSTFGALPPDGSPVAVGGRHASSVDEQVAGGGFDQAAPIEPLVDDGAELVLLGEEVAVEGGESGTGRLGTQT